MALTRAGAPPRSAGGQAGPTRQTRKRTKQNPPSGVLKAGLKGLVAVRFDG